MNLIQLFHQYQFLYRALVACFAISCICPLLGVLLLLRRMSLMADAISHSLLPGIAIGFMLSGMSVLAMTIGGVMAGLIVTILAGLVSRYSIIKEDASLALFYLLALAIGVIIISKSGTNIDLMHILFGSILAVDKTSLVALACIVSFSLLLLVAIIRPLIMDIFDNRLLKIYGVNATLYHLLFLFLVVINLVADFQILGTILVIGLMMLPAGIAKVLGNSLNMMLLIAILSGMLASFVGILLSYYYDIATGPAIIVVCGAIYLLALIGSLAIKQIKLRHYKR